MTNYAKIVKQMYWPKVSEAKHLELEQIKEGLMHRNVRKSVHVPKTNRSTGAIYHPNMPNGEERQKSADPAILEEAAPSESQSIRRRRKPLNWGLKATGASAPKEDLNNSEVGKSVDYLKELRMKREEEERAGGRRRAVPDSVWEKYMSDKGMTEFEKVEAVKKRAEMMEERARMDEELIRYTEGDRNVDKAMAVNDMYIEAITAKLKILDKL